MITALDHQVRSSGLPEPYPPLGRPRRTLTPGRWSNRQRWLLVAILALGLFGRAGAALINHDVNPHFAIAGDGPTYEQPALALLRHGRFTQGPHDPTPEFIRTPGYPGFIAAIYGVFGHHRDAVLLMQVVLSELTVLLVALLAARLGSPAVGLVAALVVTLDPWQLYATSSLLTETLDTLLLASAVAVGFHIFTRREPRTRSFMLLGLLLALATMVRPTTYYLPVLVAPLLVVHLVRRHRPRLETLRMLAVFLLPLVVIVGGWQLRNHETVGSWRFSAVEAKNVYLFRAAGVVAREQSMPFHDAHDRLLRRVEGVKRDGQGAYYGRMYRDGAHILLTHPLDTLKDMANGLIAELTSVRHKIAQYLGIASVPDVVAGALAVLLFAFYAAAIYGIVLGLRKRRDLLAHVFVLGVVAYVLLVSAGPETLDGRGERFRTVVMPILALYAARGICEIFRRLGSARTVVATATRR